MDCGPPTMMAQRVRPGKSVRRDHGAGAWSRPPRAGFKNLQVQAGEERIVWSTSDASTPIAAAISFRTRTSASRT